MIFLPKGINSNGEALSVSKSKVERFFFAHCLIVRLHQPPVPSIKRLINRSLNCFHCLLFALPS